jgi:hypothetical protein
VPALAELDLDGGGATVGLALADEGLDPTLAGVISIVDDPGLALFTLARGPNALADKP